MAALAEWLRTMLPNQKISVGAYETMGMNPAQESLFSLLRPKVLWPPPFKNWQASLLSITAQTGRNIVPFCEVWPSLALGHNVING
jgi:hypothetical protein